MKYTVESSKGVGSCGASGNDRRFYVAPQIEVVLGASPTVLYTATITQGDDDDPNNPIDIDAKKHDLNIEFRDMWEE